MVVKSIVLWRTCHSPTTWYVYGHRVTLIGVWKALQHIVPVHLNTMYPSSQDASLLLPAPIKTILFRGHAWNYGTLQTSGKLDVWVLSRNSTCWCDGEISLTGVVNMLDTFLRMKCQCPLRKISFCVWAAFAPQSLGKGAGADLSAASEACRASCRTFHTTIGQHHICLII